MGGERQHVIPQVLDMAKPPRRGGQTSAASRAKEHLSAVELPDLFKTLFKQNAAIHKAITEQTNVMRDQLQTEQNHRDWTERVHERIDAVAIEGRVTNLLLAELVSLHKSMVTETIEPTGETIRNDAYHRVLNGE